MLHETSGTFNYKALIGLSDISKSNVRGAACTSVDDLKLLRVGLTFQPLSLYASLPQMPSASRFPCAFLGYP
jgi:hypothetical protein